MTQSKVVTDLRTLRALERAGFITVCSQRPERHWTGAMVRSRWVQVGERLADNPWACFKRRGREYRLRYLDGCFHPFVTRDDIPARLPAFV